MRWPPVYVGVWLGAAVLSVLLTGICRRVAPRLGFVDRPLREKHKRHSRATPVLGGPAMLAAWSITICAGLLGATAFKHALGAEMAGQLAGIRDVLPQLLLIMLGATGLVVLGMADDRWNLSATSKFAGQLCIAGIVSIWGVRVTFFWSNPLVTWALTTLWLLTVINALNFLDNMDGLAAGLATIASFFFTFAAAARGQWFVAVLAAATCGTASGFLAHNRPPAAIFMGDGGSHLLGFLLGVVGALTTYYTTADSLSAAPVTIPVLILGVPLFDAVAVVMMRLRQGKPIYVGDHTHISHRFTKLGLSRPQAVMAIYLLAFAVGAGAVTLLWLPGLGALVVFLQTGAILGAVSLVQFYGSHRNGNDT